MSSLVSRSLLGLVVATGCAAQATFPTAGQTTPATAPSPAKAPPVTARPGPPATVAQPDKPPPRPEPHWQRFDRQSKQTPVETEAQLDAVLKSLRSVHFAKLDKQYKQRVGFGKRRFRYLSRRKVYVPRGADRFRYLVGRNRIIRFLSRGAEFWRNMGPYEHPPTPMMINKRLLGVLLKLRQELKRRKLDHDAIWVLSAFRDPQHNSWVGGDPASLHVHGMAIDLMVADVNRDGFVDRKDKDIVYRILDRKLLRGRGGIGRYPNRRSIHFDVRGSRARW